MTDSRDIHLLKIIAYGARRGPLRGPWSKIGMSPRLDTMTESACERLLEPIWSFLSATKAPVPSDVIFVFGSRAIEVPRRAAELYAADLSPRVLVSGRLGPMTEQVFSKPEALVFKDELLRLGVPDRAITTEVAAGNTLENVRFGMSALEATGHTPRSALLVAKTFAMRRCLATFARHHPEIDVRGCPPAGSLAAQRDRPWTAFAARLVGELRRLDDYGALGDIETQAIPETARAAARQVRRLLGQ